jgi:succinate-semialdehyde dehydrogenase/glutarate-semialdehyde dehydrogenase
LISKKQQDLIAAQVTDAVDKGAQVETGGYIPVQLQGAYYAPTILTKITKEMRVWNEETFGPVLPVMPYTNETEAVALANDTEYGLTAHVLTNDKVKFNKIAAELKAGSIAQNQTGFWNSNNPFGGYKKSGLGRTHGEFGFNEVTNIKVVSSEK